MVDIKPLLHATSAIQAANLASLNLKLAKRRKKRAMDFAAVGLGTVAGVALLTEQEKLIDSI